MVLSDYIKLRILSCTGKALKYQPLRILEDEIIVSKQSIRLFLKRFSERGYIGRKPGSGMTLKLIPNILVLIDH